MTDKDRQFEDLLRELKPRKLSPELEEKLTKLPEPTVAAAPAAPPAPKRQPLTMFWAAAAGFLLALGVIGWQAGWITTKPDAPEVKPPNTADADSGELFIEPVSFKETLTGEYDEGVHSVGEDGEPVRRIRREFLRETRFVDPKTGKTVTVHEPIEDIVFVQLEHF